MKTLEVIRKEKSQDYLRGFRRGQRKSLDENSLHNLRRNINEQLQNYVQYYFRGKEYSTRALERYVGLMDGFEVPVCDVILSHLRSSY